MPLEFDLDGVDDARIGSLLEFLAHSDVAEFEIEQGECRLSVRRAVGEGRVPALWGGGATADGLAVEGPAVVRASAVGVFYRSERRGGSPRVQVGDRVKAGDALGSIEVMRVPHPVLSTHEGFVEAFLVEDGQPVEYGEGLVALSTAEGSRGVSEGSRGTQGG